MTVVEKMRKPVPDGGVIRDVGKQAFLYLLGKIGPQLKGRPAKDFLKVRHRRSPSLNGPMKNTRRSRLFL